MKKLVTAFALCASISAMAAVTSENIVGYTTTVASGQYFSSGATFIKVGTSLNAKWRLGDVKAIGMDPTADNIQFLNVTDANVSLKATYVDLAAAEGDESLVGWWDPTKIGEEGGNLDNQEFDIGAGFLSNFSSTGISLQYAGEVLTGATEIDCSGQQYPMISNFLPLQITLGDLTATGMDPTSDNIQFLNVVDANVEFKATYVDLAAAEGDEALVGWWDPTKIGEEGGSLNATVIPAGRAFLANFSSTSVKIQFPSPIN